MALKISAFALGPRKTWGRRLVPRPFAALRLSTKDRDRARLFADPNALGTLPAMYRCKPKARCPRSGPRRGARLGGTGPYRSTCLAALAIAGITSAAPVTWAKPKGADRAAEQAFQRRLAALKAKYKPIKVQMAPGEDPAAHSTGPAPEGPVLVSGRRLGIYTPPVLSAEDVQLVVQQHMVEIRTCYKQQLRKDPEWSDHLILDLAIKRTGRVSEVGVAPRRVRRAVIGRCIMRAVPRWRFPRFTGETGDGITQEVVNASFPFSFSTR